jgi:hypothetical protein
MWEKIWGKRKMARLNKLTEKKVASNYLSSPRTARQSGDGAGQWLHVVTDIGAKWI